MLSAAIEPARERSRGLPTSTPAPPHPASGTPNAARTAQRSAFGIMMVVRMLDPASFSALAALVRERAGISLKPGKESMVESRLSRRVRELGLADVGQYVERARRDEDELVRLIDAISTNVTSFFREEHHFTLLRQELDHLGRDVRIWSAASSSGEEPYSIAMTVAAARGERTASRVLATDISTQILARARAGRYGDEAVRPVPATLRSRYLTPVAAGVTEVAAAVKRLVVFDRLNLIETPFPMRGPFDAVFCRNVMIYFENPTRQALLTEIHRLLAPQGLLLIGHAESLAGMDLPFTPIRGVPSAYRRA
jgi:chemotaxis protein methyltransferase CheR